MNVSVPHGAGYPPSGRLERPVGTPCGQVARGDPPLPPPITPRSFGHLGRCAGATRGRESGHVRRSGARRHLRPLWHSCQHCFSYAVWHHTHGPKGGDLMPGQGSDWEVHEGAPRKQGAGPSTVLRISGVKGTGRIVYQLAPDDDTLLDRPGRRPDRQRAPRVARARSGARRAVARAPRAVPTLTTGTADEHRLRQMADRQGRRLDEEPARSRAIARR